MTMTINIINCDWS